MGNLVKNGISYTGGSGASSYNELNDKPSINGVTLSGNKTLGDLGIATEINELDDVDISTPSNNDVLKYNPTSGKWENGQGGGGGSTYTAGDGIDITEDVISTEKSQEGDIDEIIDVYPQAGKLVSIVNAFNRGDIYSTDEKMIGQWIDGKPLYQKSFEFPSTVTITKGSWRDSGVAIQNAEQVLNAFIISNQYHLCAPIQACVSTTLIPSGNIGLYSGKDDDMLMDSLTVQYTKTTDTAISIGSETEYSTDEKVIGTWIDGKPLYQRTVHLTNVSLPPANQYTDIDVLTDTTCKLKSYTGILMDNNYDTSCLPVNSMDRAHGTIYWTGEVVQRNGTGKITIKFVNYSSSIMTWSDAYITLQYTKSTT